jgi:hypothetical protein
VDVSSFVTSGDSYEASDEINTIYMTGTSIDAGGNATLTAGGTITSGDSIDYYDWTNMIWLSSTSLTAAGDVTLSASGDFTAAGSFYNSDMSNSVHILSSSIESTGGSIWFTAAGEVTALGDIDVFDDFVTSSFDDSVLRAAGDVTVDVSGDYTAGGAFSNTDMSNSVHVLGSSIESMGGSISFTADGEVTVLIDIDVFDDFVTSTFDGSLLRAAGDVSVDVSGGYTAGGAFTLNMDSNCIIFVGSPITAGGTITMTADGSLSVGGTTTFNAAYGTVSSDALVSGSTLYATALKGILISDLSADFLVATNTLDGDITVVQPVGDLTLAGIYQSGDDVYITLGAGSIFNELGTALVVTDGDATLTALGGVAGAIFGPIEVDVFGTLLVEATGTPIETFSIVVCGPTGAFATAGTELGDVFYSVDCAPFAEAFLQTPASLNDLLEEEPFDEFDPLPRNILGLGREVGREDGPPDFQFLTDLRRPVTGSSQ